MSIDRDLVDLCGAAADRLGEPLRAEVRELGDRLEGPLRIAFAGRVKAGKSTLLNALVGERMAPTDAAECTRIVTWYRQGPSYAVVAELADLTERALSFRRNEGALEIDLGGLSAADVERLHVAWPSSRLDEITLIDTPGLASVTGEASARTLRFLTPGDERGTEADAVIYLMRHVHRSDVEFLDAFMDRSVAFASPINAVAVLSRADEIGGGRLDALGSAGRIAARYRSDEALQGLTSTVLPIAGLLAEAGSTLREDEFTALRDLAGEDDATLDALLVTADRFLTAGLGPLTIEVRRDLLGRMGIFGIRFALDLLRGGAVATSQALADAMVAASGLRELRDLLVTRFLPRSRVLKARAVLGGLRSVARRADPEVGTWLADEVERIEATASELGELRLLHLAVAGVAGFGSDERAEITRLVLGTTPEERTGTEDPRSAALEAIERWRLRASDPRNDPSTIEACDLAVRAYERILVGPAQG
jgi:hypothetical protein